MNALSAPSLPTTYATTTTPGAIPNNRHLSSDHHHRVPILINSPDSSGARAILRGKLGRRVVAHLLWHAFPECRSEEQVAERASRVLGMDQRHVRRLLDCEHSVNIDTGLAVIALAGFEAFMAAYKAIAK